jgi:hypothetical protein
MDLSILGTIYDYMEIDANKDQKMHEVDGYCDGSSHTIRVNNNYGNSILNMADLKNYKKLVQRHEIIHAFLCESGLQEYSNNEIIVEWIAKQFPKLLDTFKAIKAI